MTDTANLLRRIAREKLQEMAGPNITSRRNQSSTPPPSPTAGSGAPWGTTINNAGRWLAGAAQKTLGQEPTQGLGSQKTTSSHLAPNQQPSTPSGGGLSTAAVNSQKVRQPSSMGSSQNINTQPQSSSNGRPIRPNSGPTAKDVLNRPNKPEQRVDGIHAKSPTPSTPPQRQSLVGSSAQAAEAPPSRPSGLRHQAPPTRPTGPPGNRHQISPTIMANAQRQKQAQSKTMPPQKATNSQPKLRMAAKKPARPSKPSLKPTSAWDDTRSNIMRGMGQFEETVPVQVKESFEKFIQKRFLKD